MRTRDNKDFASQFKWLEDRQVKDLEIIEDEEQLKMFCQLASSENHERNECLSSNGQTIGSEYGKNTKSVIGLIDWIIGSWIKKGK